MGIIKDKVNKEIKTFIADNNNSNEKAFAANLSGLIKKLNFFLNQEIDNTITEDTIIIHTDGSSKGNPGEAKIGVIIKDASGQILHKIQKEIGISTNNQSEYTAVIEALRFALDKGYKKIILRSDSELIINQINNVYKISNTVLNTLYKEVKELEKRLDFIKFIHVRREFNKEADLLSR